MCSIFFVEFHHMTIEIDTNFSKYYSNSIQIEDYVMQNNKYL